MIPNVQNQLIRWPAILQRPSTQSIWGVGVRRQAFFLISDNQNSPWVFKVASAGQARSEALCCP